MFKLVMYGSCDDDTVKHVYFASIKFSRFEYNCEINYPQIFGITHYHDVVCIEYQLFHDMICNILGII